MAELRRSTEARQAELIDAALHIIATQGIAALTTRSLAEHVGLTSGAIFRHFASIDALIEGVVARVESVMESTFPPAGLPPGERLDRFVEARSTAVGGQVGIMQLMLSEQFILALSEGGTARLAGCAQKTREFVLTCLREGQAAGSFRTDLDAGALVVVVMGTIQMLALSAAKRRQLGTAPQVVRDALGALLRPPPPVATQGTRATGSRGRRAS
ncbi:MAG: TetR/AcrR family transcriptional regulator [Deltaproteobacteria bacterium]|nr:TetR/AcrR family transcriptional regulator [Myxococcales bacterium]MDP3215113.1 TetR/AcrR family transcriptional regulator [Deltaproteobacteria bacterium]